MKLELPYPPGVNTLYGVRAVVKREPLVKLLLETKRGLDIDEAATRVQRLAQAFPFKTSEHTAYATQARLAAYEAGLTHTQLPRWPRPTQLALEVRLFRPRKAGDVDGPLKTLLDSLQGVMFENDDQVARLVVDRDDDKDRPRVELTFSVVGVEQPALDLGAVASRPPPSRSLEQLNEPWTRKVRRLAQPAVVSNRPTEPPEAA